MVLEKMLKKKTVAGVILILLLSSSSALFANPFTGNKKSPTPVQRKAPSDTIINQQRTLNTKLGEYIAGWKNDKTPAVMLSILGLSFLYGLLHAAGPGHRKTVLFSFYLTRDAKPFEPLISGLLLALFHAGTAVVLMFVFKGATGAISVNSNNAMIYLEGITFLILIFLALYGIADAIHDLLSKKQETHKNLKLGAILLSGLYPCPAAMLVLVFAVNLSVLRLGIISVIAMSVGMAVPITVSGYLAWAGRTGLFHKLKSNERLVGIIAASLQIIGFSFLLIFSVKISLPFIIGLLK